VTGTDLIDIRTGELIGREDVPKLAEAIVGLRELKQQVNDVLAAMQEAIFEQAKLAGTKTFTVGGGKKARIAGGTEIVWDIEILERLKDEGLPESRWDELVTIEIAYKVSAAVAKQLAGANEVYAEIIAEARTDVAKKRYVTVGR
jgi:hypothetical protein